MTTEPIAQPAPLLKDRAGNFLEPAAYVTWRVVARNQNFTGETETFGFSNGKAVVPALPAGAKCGIQHQDGDERPCALHDRLRHLNNIVNYPAYELRRTRQGPRMVDVPTYRVLSEDEYNREFGEQMQVDLLDDGFADEEL